MTAAGPAGPDLLLSVIREWTTSTTTPTSITQNKRKAAVILCNLHTFKLHDMASPWIRTEVDEDGSLIVVVTDDHVENFSKFMDSVINEKVGLDRGYFKIRLENGSTSSTNLSEILAFVKSYFTSKDVKTKRFPKPDSQTFFFSSDHEDLYGFRVNIVGRNSQHTQKKSVQNFLQAVSNTHTFTNQSNCCLDALNAGVKELSAHYWKYVRQHAISGSISAPTVGEQASIQDNAPLLYGSSIPLKVVEFPISKTLNLSKLNTLLDIIPDKIPGLSFPYLYVGSQKASFPFHIEDVALFSINYLHFGAPCVWFIVAPHHYKKFLDLAHQFKLDIGQVSCNNIFGHKYVMASEEFLLGLGITVHTVVQRVDQIVVTYPFAAHSGFKCGFNIQQAANFGHPWWVESAILAPTCTCFKSQVNLNLTNIIAAAKPHLLDLYVGNDVTQLMKELSKNDFVRKLGLFPVDDHQKVTAAGSKMRKSPKSSARVKVARCTLKCSDDDCSETWTGGRGRLGRVVAHIKKEHKISSTKLIVKLHKMYPPKDTSQDCQCTTLCGRWFSGNSSHLKRHMSLVHKINT